MRLADIDLHATSGDTGLHRASPVAKLLGGALVLAAVIVTRDVLVVLTVSLTLVAAQTALGLPVARIVTAAAYPLFFAVVFAFSASGDPLVWALIILKATGAALIAVMLVYTTPYPQVFAPLQRVLPRLIGDSLLVTYRSFFLMADKLQRLIRAVRLRSGERSAAPWKRIPAMMSALGNLLLYGFDLAQRDYDVLRLRGYEGRFVVKRRTSASRAADAGVLAVSALLLAIALLWRLRPDLSGYSWGPATVAATALATASVVRLAYGRDREVGASS